MKKTTWIVLALLAVTLTLLLSGCGTGEQDLDGMYVVTFDLNGGKLDTRTSVVDTKINYAYQPDTLILDPTQNADKKLGYNVSRSGYVFTGWYTGAECLPEQKWDFTTGKITEEKLTLFAGWEKKIVYTYSVCYKEGDTLVTRGSYTVAAGEAFDDYLKYANKRTGYTPYGYYADPACTIPWDFATVHPGGATDTDIPVYVSYIEGNWTIVDTYAKLVAAIGKGSIYLTADIDCGGNELKFGTFANVLEGNGHKISNFVVSKSGGAIRPSCSIFEMLSKGAELRNVSFTDVKYQLYDIAASVTTVKVAALARDAKDCIISNVTVSGQFLTDYQGDLSTLHNAFYGDAGNNQVTDFNAQDIEIVVQPKS